MMIKISVIIPTYNREKTINYCLNSAINQSYPIHEIIVIDDCSTDKTCDIVASMKDKRIKLISLEENRGAQYARNQGILAATGDWIAFLDSDDYWEVNKLELQINILQERNFDNYLVIHGNCYIWDGDVKHNRKIWMLPLTEGNVYESLLTRPSPMFQAILVSRKAIIEAGLLDEAIISYQEWDTSIKLSKICSFIHIKEPLFTYVLHKGDTISKDKSKEILGYFNIIEKYKKEILSFGKNNYNHHILGLLLKCIDYQSNEYKTIFIDKLIGVSRFKKQLLLKLLSKKYLPFLRKFFLRILLSFKK